MPASDEILHHIRHAESWLRWARSDFRRGDLRSAMLRLLLAEAEIRHAREEGMRVPPRLQRRARIRRLWPAALGSVAALLVAAAGYVVMHAGEFQAPVPADPAAHAPLAVPPTRPPQEAGAVAAGRFLTLASPVAGGGGDGAPGWSETWAVGPLPDRFSDDPTSRFGRATPAVPRPPAGVTAPGDLETPSPTF